jgi:hypothetical protein
VHHFEGASTRSSDEPHTLAMQGMPWVVNRDGIRSVC